MRLNQEILDNIGAYRLPRFAEIPNVGLYLNQVAKYINEYMEPFQDMKLTESMISNYVKKHLISSPVKKQYDREQIASLIFIALAKSVLSMDNIQMLFDMQKESYEKPLAFDYFADEFENVLQYVFGIRGELEQPEEMDETKVLCRDVLLAVAQKLYLDQFFASVKK
ncbi:MAG: DUF1836 domain-containing protein [Clostridiales bacterium]|nr:DUF1836 domain-containing protein [Candidatus Blautia equi]